MNEGNKLGRAAAVIIPLLLVCALAFTGAWGSEQSARAETLERGVQDLYKQTYYELSDNVSDMQVALKKLLVVSSPSQHVLLLSDVWRLSGAAATNLSALPQSHADTAATTRFIVQAGDFAHALTKRILGGEIVSADDREQLYALYEASVSVSRGIFNRIQNEDFPAEPVTNDGYYAESADPEGKDGDSAANYPKLIYDGPFSDSTERAEPRGLPETEVDVNAALLAAQEYLGGSGLTLSGEGNGSIAAYVFSGSDADGRPVELAVTKRGGKVLWMMAETAGGEEGVPDAATTAAYRDAAKAFLDAREYGPMQATYAQYYAGVAVLNFAATEGGVILYSDLVKVYVERASGKVVGIDANNYLFSHRTRTLPLVMLTQEEARGSVSEELEVQSVALALIPKPGGRETLCYEFKGVCRGASFIVYVNAQTGLEEDVFEIIDSDEGQLVV